MATVPAHFQQQQGSSPSNIEESDMTSQETAAAMLTPVLSRARQQLRQEERDTSGPSESTQDSSRPSIDKADIHHGLRNLKTTAQVINAFKHPVHMPSFKGGEGIRRLVETREKDGKFLWMSVEYWDISLFSFRGRAWPMLPQVLYIIYSAVMVAVTVQFVPGYANVAEMKALQFPIQTMGLALFLLLAFRTNSSYDRWWEGRKLWDGINTKVLDTARLALGWVAPKDKNLASGITRWALTFAFAAKKALRLENKYPELAGILGEAEIQQLESSIDPVSLVSHRLTQLISDCEAIKVPPPLFNALDNNVRGLNSDLAACERILSTPMPFAYIVHLRSFMVLWLLGLPFAFVVSLGYWSILVCSVVGYELLGFETIGVEIENPFGRDYNDLPLDLITSELFVRLADVLARLGHMVDVEPILVADPLRNDCPHHHLIGEHAIAESSGEV